MLRLKPLATLLLEAFFSAILPDLNHVVLPTPPPLLRVDGHLVPVPADLRPSVRPQRHRLLLMMWKKSETLREREAGLGVRNRVLVSSSETREKGTLRLGTFNFVCVVFEVREGLEE